MATSIQFARADPVGQLVATVRAHANVKPRERPRQLLDRFDQDDVADRMRHADPQGAGGRCVPPCQRHQLVDRAQDRQRLLVHTLAERRRGRRALRPIKQCAAECLLELLNAARDGGLGQK
jgi:hypothetical protein